MVIIYYLAVSGGQFTFDSELSQGCSTAPRAACISKTQLGRILFQAHLRDCWHVSGARRLLARGFPRSLPCGPPHGATHNMAACFSQSKQAREQEMATSAEVPGILNLILEVTSHHIHCILFVRSELPGPVSTRGEEITQRHEYRGVEGHWSRCRAISRHTQE